MDVEPSLSAAVASTVALDIHRRPTVAGLPLAQRGSFNRHPCLHARMYRHRSCDAPSNVRSQVVLGCRPVCRPTPRHRTMWTAGRPTVAALCRCARKRQQPDGWSLLRSPGNADSDVVSALVWSCKVHDATCGQLGASLDQTNPASSACHPS